MFKMPGKSYQGPFLPLNQEEQAVKEELKEIVTHLADVIGERNIWHYQNLTLASEYISYNFRENGFSVNEFSYLVEDLLVKNIMVQIKGNQAADEIVVIGAHYDTVLGSPGADDNASGVAALLVLAKLLAKEPLAKTVHFVAFVNEEMPFFYTKNMGSFQYAKKAYHNKENIVAMFSLESIGYYSEEKGSQHYPYLFNFLYPNQANFIGFVGNFSSRKLIEDVIKTFRNNVDFPSEGYSGPSLVPGVGWSDQWSFWKHGFKAMMITGTALYRNPNYHTERDIPSTIDYDRMARVVWGLKSVFQKLYG